MSYPCNIASADPEEPTGRRTTDPPAHSVKGPASSTRLLRPQRGVGLRIVVAGLISHS